MNKKKYTNTDFESFDHMKDIIWYAIKCMIDKVNNILLSMKNILRKLIIKSTRISYKFVMVKFKSTPTPPKTLLHKWGINIFSYSKIYIGYIVSQSFRYFRFWIDQCWFSCYEIMYNIINESFILSYIFINHKTSPRVNGRLTSELIKRKLHLK